MTWENKTLRILFDLLIETKRIGRQLDVRYVLEGSVQRLGTQVRITAQLIDAEADAHLWAERFEREVGELFCYSERDYTADRNRIAKGACNCRSPPPTQQSRCSRLYAAWPCCIDRVCFERKHH